MKFAEDEQKRFIRVFLIIFSAFLMFGGPTYLLWVLQLLETPHVLNLLIGLSSFALGVVLFFRFIREEKI